MSRSASGQSDADRVLIFDTTLRDGEQSPGISLNKQEKLEIAHQLARLGVDVIEAGFPITSPGDFESVQAIAREVEGPVICALARTVSQDIEAVWNAVRDSQRPRIHMVLATSDLHIKHKLQTTREDVKGQVRAAVAQARQYTDDVECSVNGIGERAGNASLEEIAMLLHTREPSLGLWTEIETTEIARASRLVSRLTGYQVQPNKAIVGRSAFAHEAGIHQDGVLKERTTYEIMDATTVGLNSNSLVLGKHSGRHALSKALEEMGFEIDGQALNTAFKRFKEIADRKKQVTAMDLEALVTDELRSEDIGGFALDWFEVESSSLRRPHAKVSVTLP